MEYYRYGYQFKNQVLAVRAKKYSKLTFAGSSAAKP
jgi:hypothetical protein